jgi:RND family efflux transporter MFP subunit
MKRLSIIALLSTALLASCGGGKKAGSTEAQLAELKKQRTEIDAKIAKLEATAGGTGSNRPATPVSIMVLQPTSFTSAIDVQASITGSENVVASAQAPGTVTRILVRPGQHVSRGQTLAELDASALSQSVAAQDAQVNLLRELYQKQQKLWAQNIGTEVQLLTAKAAYEGAARQRAALAAQRAQFRIVAPVSGTVDQFDLKVGDLAQLGGGMNGMAGIRIVNLSQLKATANLGENYLGKVKQGDPVTIAFDELGETIQTKLSYVGQSVNPSSRTFGVEARLAPTPRLRPNMSCRIMIANYEANNALAVPVNVLQQSAQGSVVYVADGKKAKAVPVQTGRTYNGQVEILAGLQPGDRIITEGYQELDNGEPITF